MLLPKFDNFKNLLIIRFENEQIWKITKILKKLSIFGIARFSGWGLKFRRVKFQNGWRFKFGN